MTAGDLDTPLAVAGRCAVPLAPPFACGDCVCSLNAFDGAAACADEDENAAALFLKLMVLGSRAADDSSSSTRGPSSSESPPPRDDDMKFTVLLPDAIA